MNLLIKHANMTRLGGKDILYEITLNKNRVRSVHVFIL